MGLKSEERGRIKTLSPQDIGHYKSLLSRLIESERPSLDNEEWEGQRAFWTVLVRHLKKKLESQGIEIPTITGEITSKQLSDETLAALYPEDKPLNLSASSLTNFYNNQYLYFVRNVLRLREQESIHPTAFQHGLFLHRIFERVVMDQSELDFDQKWTRQSCVRVTRQNLLCFITKMRMLAIRRRCWIRLLVPVRLFCGIMIWLKLMVRKRVSVRIRR